jgi:hypothetical protein
MIFLVNFFVTWSEDLCIGTYILPLFFALREPGFCLVYSDSDKPRGRIIHVIRED